jgi:hypothetical protein
MFGVCCCALVYAVWLAGACAAVTGHVVWCGGVWLAGYVAGCVHEHGCVYGWLALWLSLKTRRFWRANFSAFSASKSPKNSFKIAAKFAGILADFMLIFAPQKPKPKNAKSASKNETQNLKPKAKT